MERLDRRAVSATDSYHLNTAEGEYVELELQLRPECREDIVRLRRLVCTSPNVFLLSAQFSPSRQENFRSGLERLTRNGLSVGSSIP